MIAEKEYDEFYVKYPMNGELDLQKETLKAMDYGTGKWTFCTKESAL